MFKAGWSKCQQFRNSDFSLFTFHFSLPSSLFTFHFSLPFSLSLYFLALILFSCESEEANNGPRLGVRDSLPWLKSRGVSTLISDSGIIRYKLISEDWYMFDKKDPTYWAFEKGLFLEKFDASYHVEAFINCDTAYYFDQRHLWELRGRVFIKNTKGETFKTSLLYWDQNTREFFSPAYMEIQGETQSLKGTDFRSNEQMTQYSIHQSSGDFPFEEEETGPPVPEAQPATP